MLRDKIPSTSSFIIRMFPGRGRSASPVAQKEPERRRREGLVFLTLGACLGLVLVTGGWTRGAQTARVRDPFSLTVKGTVGYDTNPFFTKEAPAAASQYRQLFLSAVNDFRPGISSYLRLTNQVNLRSYPEAPLLDYQMYLPQVEYWMGKKLERKLTLAGSLYRHYRLEPDPAEPQQEEMVLDQAKLALEYKAPLASSWKGTLGGSYTESAYAAPYEYFGSRTAEISTALTWTRGKSQIEPSLAWAQIDYPQYPLADLPGQTRQDQKLSLGSSWSYDLTKTQGLSGSALWSRRDSNKPDRAAVSSTAKVGYWWQPGRKSMVRGDLSGTRYLAATSVYSYTGLAASCTGIFLPGKGKISTTLNLEQTRYDEASNPLQCEGRLKVEYEQPVGKGSTLILGGNYRVLLLLPEAPAPAEVRRKGQVEVAWRQIF